MPINSVKLVDFWRKNLTSVCVGLSEDTPSNDVINQPGAFNLCPAIMLQSFDANATSSYYTKMDIKLFDLQMIILANKHDKYDYLISY